MPRFNTRAVQLLLALFAAASLVDGAEAADTGNVLAALIGTFLGIVAVCAGIGWWARRQGGGSSHDDSAI